MKKIILIFLSFTILSFAADAKPRILVGSPVCQKPNILKEFLTSLDELESDQYILDYYFIDDNRNPESKKQLESFAISRKTKCYIHLSQDFAHYVCDEFTHQWTNDLVEKVAEFKDGIIKHARQDNYDYLFLIDSDIVLNPQTLHQLIRADKEIVANIFWTKWTPSSDPLPQVWVSDFYTLYKQEPSEELSDLQIATRTHHFLSKLKIPGTHEVGGLGACTLISKKALDLPISFKRLPNLSFWGEDRHFCIRAAAFGIPLYVDTHYPAYHIFRESELAGVAAFKANSDPAPMPTVLKSNNL